MRITQVTVIDENGKTHTWTGAGHVHTRSAQKKSEFQGAPGKIYGNSVDVHLVVPLPESKET